MKYLTLLSFSFVLFSCVYNHTDNIKELGGKYYYLGDGRESQILFNLKEDGEPKVGREVVPPTLLEYKFNEQYIIAKSKDDTQKVIYWIIDKTTENVGVTPLDSVSFYQVLTEKKIDLAF